MIREIAAYITSDDTIFEHREEAVNYQIEVLEEQVGRTIYNFLINEFSSTVSEQQMDDLKKVAKLIEKKSLQLLACIYNEFDEPEEVIRFIEEEV